MTIIAAWVTPERAVLAVDTIAPASMPDGTTTTLEINKLEVDALSHVASAGRGDCLFLASIGDHNAMQPYDIVAVPDLLPARVRAIRQQLAPMYETSPNPAVRTALDNLNLAVLGWSRRDRRALGFALAMRGDEITVDPIDGDWCVPWHESLGLDPWPSDDVSVLGLARRQLDLLHEHDPQAATGGQIIRADIDASGLTVRNLGPIL